MLSCYLNHGHIYGSDESEVEIKRGSTVVKKSIFVRNNIVRTINVFQAKASYSY